MNHFRHFYSWSAHISSDPPVITDMCFPSPFRIEVNEVSLAPPGVCVVSGHHRRKHCRGELMVVVVVVVST